MLACVSGDMLLCMLDALLRSSPFLRSIFVMLRCAHFFNYFQWLYCHFTVNLGKAEAASRARSTAKEYGLHTAKAQVLLQDRSDSLSALLLAPRLM